VNFDPLFNSGKQASCLETKGSQQKNLMKAVSGSDWGHDKKTLFLSYKALVESVFSFCVGIWFPNSKLSNIARLQIIQNAAMRFSTGCHMAYLVVHLHAETKLMPIDEHLLMLCAQFLVSCLCRNRPSHDVVKLPPGPQNNKHGRPLKETLSSRFLDVVTPHLVDGIVLEASYNRIRNKIHTTVVRNYIQSALPKRVLGIRPPEISRSEKTLPRIASSTQR
jgi:hypothetical protein